MDIIDSKQKEIIEEFDILDGDFEMMLNYLMELGDKMLPIKEKYKVEENIIKGCQSKVWLIYKLENNRFGPENSRFRPKSSRSRPKGIRFRQTSSRFRPKRLGRKP